MRVKSLLLELLLLNQHSSSFGEIVHASINAQPSPKTQSPFKVPFIRSIRPRATVTSQQENEELCIRFWILIMNRSKLKECLYLVLA